MVSNVLRKIKNELLNSQTLKDTSAGFNISEE